MRLARRRRARFRRPRAHVLDGVSLVSRCCIWPLPRVAALVLGFAAGCIVHAVISWSASGR